VILFCLEGRTAKAGLLAGLLVLKPQFAIAFVVYFAASGSFRALVNMMLVPALLSAILIADAGLHNSVMLVSKYSAFGQHLVLAPYISGLPVYLFATPFALLLSIIPQEIGRSLTPVSTLLAASGGALVAFFSYTSRRRPPRERAPFLAVVVLYPVIFTPYCMLYDLAPLLVLPALIPAVFNRHHVRLWFLWTWVYPFFAAASGVLIGAVLPLFSFFKVTRELRR